LLSEENGCGEQQACADESAFHCDVFLRVEPRSLCEGPDAMIVAPHGYVAKAAFVKTLL
jgi:hypothetical protein